MEEKLGRKASLDLERQCTSIYVILFELCHPERFQREMDAMRRSRKHDGVGIVPGVTVFGISKHGTLPCDQVIKTPTSISKHGALLCDQDTDVKVSGSAPG